LDDPRGLRDLRRLRVIGIAAPAVFLVLCEAIRLTVLDPVLDSAIVSLLIGGAAVAAAIAFGWMIFVHIDLAEREIVRRNRDLATVTAVSLAIRDEIDLERALQRALRALVDTAGAAEASVVVAAGADGAPGCEVVVHRPESDLADALGGPDETLDLPLTAGTSEVGRLRLRVAAARRSQLPSADALAMAGQHLTATIQISQLIRDLHRRRDDGHTFYATLLQISNRAALLEVLETVAAGARERLAADSSRVCLSPVVIRDLDPSLDLDQRGADAVTCAEAAPGSEAGRDAEARTHQCVIAQGGTFAATLQVPIWSSDERVGDLWVGRRSESDFTQRDRQYLLTLAGLTSIAITAARAREHEAHAAILAERDRIARELHDSLAQVLGSTHLRLRAQLARQELDDRPAVRAELEDLATITEDAYHDVREAILGLREASRPRGLIEALHAYLEKYGVQSGIRTELETAVDGEPDLPTKAEIQVIRVIQEALTNVRKHARATTVRVRVHASSAGDVVTIVVEDDGRGFEPDEVTVHRDGGFGLQTMRERMELAGGSVRVDSAPGRGTRVIANVPATSAGVGVSVLPDHR
jgi:signal transduction histidine kinase